MAICAYCLKDKKLTREHLFPKSISDSIKIEDGQTYLDKSSTKYIGTTDIVVKDVCADCNNNILGELDAYAKELYDGYFSKIIIDDKLYPFSYDYEKLSRWLLKISYNSARVHNADVDILLKYREHILSKSKPPNSYSIFVHLIAPYKDDESGEIEYPEGWRISQIRLATRRVISCVQRCVFINSFCFTLFVLDSDEKIENLNLLKAEFLQQTRNAIELNQAMNTIQLKIGDANAISSLATHWFLNPGLYKFSENELENILRGRGFGVVSFIIERDEIERQEIDRTLDFLNSLLFSREMVMRTCQALELMIDGYNEDSRELYEIPEVKTFIKSIHRDFPYWHFFLNPKLSFIHVIPLCLYPYERVNGELKISKKDFEYHLLSQFDFINQLCHRFLISDEKNKQITKLLMEHF